MTDTTPALPPRRRPKTSLERACEALDWPWLLERLVAHAGSTLGQDRARALAFTVSLEEARRMLQETTELRRLLDAHRAPPIGGLQDIRGRVDAASKGDVLIARDCIDVADTLYAFVYLKRFFADEEEAAPRCAHVASGLPDLEPLARDLRESFDSAGELSTTRYPELGRLRKRLYAAHNRVREHLTEMLSSPEMETLIQDNYYTVRSDRYVIPVKVQHKNVADGIIHDASGSGQTVFIEPSSVIPLNNELKLAEGELKREERRIFLELTERVASRASFIRAGLEVAAELELILARARLSQELGASEPRLNDRGRVRLVGARHPVLALRGVDVIPNDITVGEGHQAIVISGPNTGGKTVSLKTLGLCALLVRAGLHVPAEPASEVALFRRILTDVGDTQTIEGDLSTFSGHITTIRDIVDEVDRAVASHHDAGTHTLVLLDEIAVGTDPTQGAALAQAILGALVDRGCRVVVTTHYAELKTLSTRDPRFTSARVDYDGLRPTYRLKYGSPGRSFALDVARRLGLASEIIERAEGMLSPETRKVDELVTSLERELTLAREASDKAQGELRDAESLRARYEKRLQAVEQEAERLRRDKMRAIDEEVAKARQEIKEVIRGLIAQPSNASATVAREKVRVITQRVLEKVPRPPEAEKEMLGSPVDWRSAKTGDPVFLPKLKKEGVLGTVPDSGPVEVVMGGMKTRVARDDVLTPPRKAAPPPRKPRKDEWAEVAARAPSADRLDVGRIAAPDEAPQADLSLENALQTSTNTLDLRGERVDVGLDAVDRFLDQASLAGQPAVFIIHGHGTGALRDAVRAHLARSAYIDKFQPGGRHQGGNGVTVASLR